MNQNRIDSLIALLDDPDETVFEYVLDEISNFDISNIKQLEVYYETSLDDLVQIRLEKIINKIKQQDTFQKLKNISLNEKISLLEGFFLISELQNPNINRKNSAIIIEEIRNNIISEIKSKTKALDKINILNFFFFEYYKFKIEDNFPGSENNLNINNVLNSRKGNEVTITLLYVIIANHLNLPVHYVICDKNPLIAYFTDHEDTSTENSSILFYINVLNYGAIIGPKEIGYVLHAKTEKELADITKACTEKQVLKNVISDIILRLNWLGNSKNVDFLSELEKLFF